MLLGELRGRVCAIARRMASEKLVVLTSGNVSAIDRRTRAVAITPSAVDYAGMDPQDIVVVDLEGKVLEGRWRPSSELPMHLYIYSRGPIWIGAVVHTHSVFAAALSTVVDEVPPILAETVIALGGAIPVAPYRRTGTSALGEVVADALQASRAVLLQNHGLVAAGEDPDRAYAAAVIAEEACRVYHIARALGVPRVIPQEEVEALKGLKYGPQPLAPAE